MDTSFEQNKDKIINEIKTRVGQLTCPMCKTNEFILGGGYFAHDLQFNFNERRMGGVNIPTIPIICKKCGFVAEFAAGPLGLLPKNNDKDYEAGK